MGPRAEIARRKVQPGLQAADLGADAIVNLRIEFSMGYASIAVKSTGTAVKYINK